MNPHSGTVIVCPLTLIVHRVYSFEVFLHAGDARLEYD